jgi:hypothetical protein
MNLINEQGAPTIWDLLAETARFLWKDWPVDMRVTAIDKRNQVFTLNGSCPHCGHLAVFVEVTNKYKETDANGFVTSASVMLCQGCARPILGIIRYFSSGDHSSYVAHYPLGKPDDTVGEGIPDYVASDFKEALRCRWVDAYNATVEMCRRALESSCLQLEADPKLVLSDMIDWVHGQGKITTSLKDMAHKVKLGGNRGAHPSDRVIEPDDADAVIEFTKQYFHHVYVMPAMMAKFDFTKPKPKKGVAKKDEGGTF